MLVGIWQIVALKLVNCTMLPLPRKTTRPHYVVLRVLIVTIAKPKQNPQLYVE